MTTKEQLKALMARKQAMEEELDAYWAELKSMNLTLAEPLVDEEGFPRSDIDVHRARIVRNSIRSLKNDHSKLMKEIAEGLKTVHGQSDNEKSESAVDAGDTTPTPAPSTASRKAFAKVTSVSPDSPAANAGLHAGDEVLAFGSVTIANFTGLTDVASVAQASKDRPLRVQLRRSGNVMALDIVPRTWDGRGLLGCVLTPTHL